MNRDQYPELTAEQYQNLKIGDTIKYIYYVLGDYCEDEGKIDYLKIEGNDVDSDGFYEYEYDNEAILTDGTNVPYCDIIEVIK